MAVDIKIELSKETKIGDVDFKNIAFGRTFTDHMFEADFDGEKWINARVKPLSSLNLHPANLALHYGQSIFEGMKASVNHQNQPLLFRPELHAQRFNRSAKRMSMTEVPEELFLEALRKLVGVEYRWIPKESGSALYIRPLMFATDAFLGVRSSKTFKFVILTLPVGPYYPKPVNLWAETHYVRAAAGGVGYAKAAGNYAAAMLPTEKAAERGCEQVLWMDAVEHRYAQEAGTMNVFFVIGDKVITPDLSDGTILDGITRRSAIEIMRSKGQMVEERPISIDEIREASENGSLRDVFGTGTAAIVAEVASIQGEDFHIDMSGREYIHLTGHQKCN